MQETSGLDRRAFLAGLGGTALLIPGTAGAGTLSPQAMIGATVSNRSPPFVSAGLLDSIPDSTSVRRIHGFVHKLPQRKLINPQMIQLLKSMGVSGVEDFGIKYVSRS